MTRLTDRPALFAACEHVQGLVRDLYRSPDRGHWPQLCADWDQARRPEHESIIVLFDVRMVDDRDWLARLRSLRPPMKRYLGFVCQVPAEGIAERLAKLDIRRPERVHLSRAGGEQERRRLLERLVRTWSAEEPWTEILDAWWEGDTLTVLSPLFERLHVLLSKLPVLAGGSAEQRERFEIDEDGAYLYWPDLDAHLGWEQLAQAVNPEALLQARRQDERFSRRYGAAIRRLRQRAGLRQADVPAVSARHVGRIERGQCRATLSALKSLASAHRMDTDDYMAAIAKELKS